MRERLRTTNRNLLRLINIGAPPWTEGRTYLMNASLLFLSGLVSVLFIFPTLLLQERTVMKRNVIVFTLIVCLLSVLTGSLTRADERTDREIKDEFANEQLKVLGEMYSQVSFGSARYQPYIDRPWWRDTPKSFSVKIKGVPQLPPHDLTVTFHNNNQRADAWIVSNAWKVYPGSNLKSNPTKITAKVQFKNSGFWFEETWNVAPNGALTSARHNRAKAKDTLPDDEDARTAARKFETDIQGVRNQLIIDLDNREDILNSNVVEKLQGQYSQEITMLQMDFLEHLNHNGKFEKVKFDKGKKGKDGTIYAKVLGAAAVGGGTGAVIAFVPMITVTTTGWVFWTTTSTVAIGSLGTGAVADMFISGGIITATAVVGGVAYY